MSGVLNVLVVSIPGAEHLNPMLPLVRALVGGGDRVVIAAAADMADIATGNGADYHPAAHGEGVWFERVASRTRGAPGDALAPERIDHYFLPCVFGEIGRRRASRPTASVLEAPTPWYAKVGHPVTGTLGPGRALHAYTS